MLAFRRNLIPGLLTLAVFVLLVQTAAAQYPGYPYGYTNPVYGYTSPYSVPSPWNPNPVVAGTGQVWTGSVYNPYTGQSLNTTYGEQVHASAYDPNRGYVDPGSMRQVNRYVPDGRGGFILQQGQAWTSNGVSHSDLYQTHTYQTSPWSYQQDTTHAVRAPARR